MRRRNFSFRSVASPAARTPSTSTCERRRIALVPELQLGGRNHPLIGRVLVVIDGGAQLAQRAAELDLALPLHGDMRQRHDRRRQDADERRDDEQLDEGEPRLAGRALALTF